MKYYFLAILICVSLHIPQCNAQASGNKVLSIGDTLPDIQFAMVNYKEPTAKLSSFKSKLIILDYWGRWCGSCIHAMPNLSAMQKKYGSDITILPVAFNNTQDEIKDFFDKRKGTDKEIDLPSAVYKDLDNELFEMLPTIGFPHEVWLDSNRVIIAITLSVYVTENNIRRILAGEKLSLPVKATQMDFDGSKLLPVEGNQNDSTVIYRSMLKPFIDSIPSAFFRKERTSKFTRIFYPNASIAEMVKAGVYGNEAEDLFNKKLALETSNNDRLMKPVYDTNYISNMRQRAYCYELILPSKFSIEQARHFMLEDLCRYFGIEAKFEKRQVPCWVLKRTSTSDKLKAKGGYPSFKTSIDETRITIQNIPMTEIPSFMMNKKVPLIIDETNYKGNVDIELVLTDRYNLKSLNKMLAKYDLVLKEADKYQNVLVIKDKNQM